MIEKLKRVFYCEFCKKHHLSSYTMKIHEQRCGKNPINFRKCFYCLNLEMKKYELCDDYGNSSGREMDILYCKKIENYLHPPITEHKGNFLGDTMPMVKVDEECEWFED